LRGPVEDGIDGGVIGVRDVAARLGDAQRRCELAGRTGGTAEQVSAIEAGTLARLADVERDALGGATDLVGEGLAALADLGLDGSELIQDGEGDLERIE
jgi:hypothetical protein